MTYELIDQSSARTSAAVVWVTIHTAEGPTDEFPARPDLDSGSAHALLTFFEGKTDRSCHAIADDDVLLDNLVPYNRSAWTLRNGNSRSDNLEMCGLASWSRDEWLRHTGMLRNAARWVASRLRARGIPNRRISIAQCAAGAAGYMDHNTYTKATGDGTHWDCGPNFPWDVFGEMVTDAYNGKADDDVSVADVKQALAEVLHITDLAVPMGQSNNNKMYAALLGAAQQQFNEENATQAAISNLVAAVAAVRAAEDIDVDTTATIEADVKAILSKLGVNDPPTGP